MQISVEEYHNLNAFYTMNCAKVRWIIIDIQRNWLLSRPLVVKFRKFLVHN